MVNSTANPQQMTKLTNVTAFNEISHNANTPPISIIIEAMVMVITVLDLTDPNNTVQTTHIMAMAPTIRLKVKPTMCKYCTKKM